MYAVCQFKGEKLRRQVFFHWPALLLHRAKGGAYRFHREKEGWIDLIVKWCIFAEKGFFFFFQWGRNKLTYWLIEGENWLGEAVRMWWMLTAEKKGFSNMWTNIYFFPHLSALMVKWRWVFTLTPFGILRFPGLLQDRQAWPCVQYLLFWNMTGKLHLEASSKCSLLSTAIA